MFYLLQKLCQPITLWHGIIYYIIKSLTESVSIEALCSGCCFVSRWQWATKSRTLLRFRQYISTSWLRNNKWVASGKTFHSDTLLCVVSHWFSMPSCSLGKLSRMMNWRTCQGWQQTYQCNLLTAAVDYTVVVCYIAGSAFGCFFLSTWLNHSQTQKKGMRTAGKNVINHVKTP